MHTRFVAGTVAAMLLAGTDALAPLPPLPQSFNLRFLTASSPVPGGRSAHNVGLAQAPSSVTTSLDADGMVAASWQGCALPSTGSAAAGGSNVAVRSKRDPRSGESAAATAMANCTASVLWESTATTATTDGSGEKKSSSAALGGFQESGKLTFRNNGGASDSGELFFASVSDGISREMGTNVSYGGISYNITGGSGAFEGATGWMVDVFLASPETGSAMFIDAWGIYFLPGQSDKDGVLQEGSQVSASASEPSAEGSRGILPSVHSSLLASPAPPGLFEFSLLFSTTPVDGVNHGTAFDLETLTTVVPPTGLPGLMVGIAGSSSGATTLHWLSKAHAFPNGTFVNTGTLQLQDKTGHQTGALAFQSVGLGHSGPPSGGWGFGGIVYEITGGTGVWSSVTGGVFVDMFAASPGAGDNAPFAIMAQGWVEFSA
jgi:hypothetical protein